MVDSLAFSNPSPAEAPKSSSAPPKTQKEGAASCPVSGFSYAREDLEIRYRTKDGDVLEVRRSITVAAGYTRSAGGRPDASGAGRQGAAENEVARDDGSFADLPEFPGMRGPDGCEEPGKGKDGLAGALKWVREVARQLEEQHARLLETLLKGKGGREGKEAEDARFVMFNLVMVSGKVGVEGNPEVTDEEYGVPEYWNAENTSDRIVAFATSFAGIFGNDPEFAETMVNAVAEGFKQAGEMLGELPGKAGKLNRDTRDLVFGKLDKWVEARKAEPYNQDAQPKALDPALTA